MRLFYSVILLFSTLLANAQIGVSGKVVDESGPVPQAVILLTSADGALKRSILAESDGTFNIITGAQRNVTMVIYSLGYDTLKTSLGDLNAPRNLGQLKLKASLTVLKEAVVQSTATRVEIKGDTTQFNASAFKTHSDASADELVQKMPGVVSSGGTITAQGEEVKKVLVDGKPFFGDDPNVALKSLPADAIQSVQIYDQMSDQSQFTGFDDGNGTKTMNIITKPENRNGYFGRIYGGYGSNDRYDAGGNLNWFNGARRISILGQANNINQQNFSSEDLVGVMSSGSSGGNRGGRGGGRPNFGAASNFFVGQQGGITATNAFGINYSDEWSPKVKVSGSYFFNQQNNNNNSQIHQNYFTGANAGLNYDETSESNSNNINHRLNLRLEYTMDDKNSFIYTPSFSFQDYSGSALTKGVYSFNDAYTSGTNTLAGSDYQGLSSSQNLLWRHKFEKKGRTLSLNVSADNQSQNGTKYQTTSNAFGPLLDSIVGYDQSGTLDNATNTYSARLSYTEPLTEKSQLQFDYNPSIRNISGNVSTYQSDSLDGQEFFAPALSSIYESQYMTQRAGLDFSTNLGVYNISVGADYQYGELKGAQSFPSEYNTFLTFSDVLPSLSIRGKYGNGKSMHIGYRTSIDAPSLSQLQTVIDNSNPLQLTTGNADLNRSYSHRMFGRFGSTDPRKSSSFFVFGMVGLTSDYVTNSTTIATSDTTVAPGIVLSTGGSLSKPINMDGYITTRGFTGYGWPIEKIGANLNITAGWNYSATPGMINNQENLVHSTTLTPGITFASARSATFDYTLRYSAGYSTSKNTLSPSQNTNYWQHSTFGKITSRIGRWVLSTDVTNTIYTGLSDGYNTNYTLWNASVGYKIFKDQSGELTIKVYDLLKQNTSVNRTITDSYIQDQTTQVLQQYVTLNFTYTIKAFKSDEGDFKPPWGDGPPPMGRPPGHGPM